MRLVDFAHMASQMLGMSLQARCDTGQVIHNSSYYSCDINLLSLLDGYPFRRNHQCV